jgi:hypothetical protein
MTGATAATRTLEQRVRAIEDTLAIHQIIMSYPLAIDTRNLDHVTTAWMQDGVFDRGAADPARHSGDFDGAYGIDHILQEVGGPALQKAREGGLAHIMTSPRITVDGDEAVATGYTLLVMRDGDGYRVQRPTANRWDLVRGADGWRIKRRTLRLIDGSSESRELFSRSFPPKAAT